MNYQKLLWRVTSIVVCWLLLAGCGRSAAVPWPTLEPGWKLYEKPKAGLAIALPPDWGEVDLETQTIESVLETIWKHNPKLSFFSDLQTRNSVASGAQFFGFDLSSEAAATNFATSVNVITQSHNVEIVTLDVLAPLYVEELQSTPGIEYLSHRVVSLTAGDSVEFKANWTYTMPGGEDLTLSVTQYVVLRVQKMYVLSMTTLSEQAETRAPQFEKIAQSFRILK